MTRSPDGAGLPVALLVALLLLIGVAGIGIAAGPDVVSPDVDSMAAPQDSTLPEEEPAEGEASANETYLREALGSAFEIEGDELIANDLPDLPAALVAHVSIVLVPADGPLECPEGAGADEPVCEERQVSSRDAVLIETAEARHSAAGSNFGELTVRHLRADGYVAVVQVSVLGKPAEGGTSLLEELVQDYLHSLEEAMIAAARDDRMRPTVA